MVAALRVKQVPLPSCMDAVPSRVRIVAFHYIGHRIIALLSALHVFVVKVFFFVVVIVVSD